MVTVRAGATIWTPRALTCTPNLAVPNDVHHAKTSSVSKWATHLVLLKQPVDRSCCLCALSRVVVVHGPVQCAALFVFAASTKVARTRDAIGSRAWVTALEQSQKRTSADLGGRITRCLRHIRCEPLNGLLGEARWEEQAQRGICWDHCRNKGDKSNQRCDCDASVFSHVWAIGPG